jgi:hypothetical protein
MQLTGKPRFDEAFCVWGRVRLQHSVDRLQRYIAEQGVQMQSGDLDHDGIIDRSDISMIMRLRITHSPPSDPNADFDGNGVINVLDGRSCMRMCTWPRCATL